MIAKLLRSGAVVGALLVLLAGPALASGKGTPNEAKAMAEKAAAHLQSAGAETAFADFTAGKPPFKDRDLYVVAIAQDGTDVAHGGNAALVGKNIMELRDPSGKPLVKEILAVKDAGWVEYSFQNPTTKAIEPKKSYVIHQGDYWVLVGAYAK
ncbi:Single Cache domain 2-containing protein [Tistlia consotensis]|uniref:Single Cache domain 2-containing protein n=1 Tax=Tistlia consotensis USBA 355 TaxID=560819 RepID=A0A1Y6CX28_9PROT|nr:cache domain-containing protein [Tistlia consotensis]SMF83477.1 Single Cache domain 2-containing protein [Tistlia consotensis USBA 355]SNS33959.1 Single Cache domain 2-containing protein [Tistlia consotensis]